MQALGGETHQKVAAQCRFAPEQMGAARYVEKETIRRVEGDERGISIAPVGDSFEKPPVRFHVVFGDRKGRIHRTRIGERHAEPQSENLCGVVHRHDAQRALDELRDDQRLFRRGSIRRRGAAAIRREPPEPQGQVTPRQRRHAHDDSTTSATGRCGRGGF